MVEFLLKALIASSELVNFSSFSLMIVGNKGENYWFFNSSPNIFFKYFSFGLKSHIREVCFILLFFDTVDERI